MLHAYLLYILISLNYLDWKFHLHTQNFQLEILVLWGKIFNLHSSQMSR